MSKKGIVQTCTAFWESTTMLHEDTYSALQDFCFAQLLQLTFGCLADP